MRRDHHPSTGAVGNATEFSEAVTLHGGVELLPPPTAIAVIDGRRRHVDELLEGRPEFFLWRIQRYAPDKFRVQLCKSRCQLLS